MTNIFIYHLTSAEFLVQQLRASYRKVQAFNRINSKSEVLAPA